MESLAELVPSAEAAEMLGIPLSTFHNRVRRGDITPKVQAPGKRGAFLFARADVERLREARLGGDAA